VSAVGGYRGDAVKSKATGTVSADEAVIKQADALVGREAALAVAYCGLDAWLENDKVEFRRSARVFRRLRN